MNSNMNSSVDVVFSSTGLCLAPWWLLTVVYYRLNNHPPSVRI